LSAGTVLPYTAFDTKPESEPQKFALIVTYLPSIADEPENLPKPDILLFKFNVGIHLAPSVRSARCPAMANQANARDIAANMQAPTA
jgi:hypothetical protein